MTEYFQRTLQVKAIIEVRPDLIERIRMFYEMEYPLTLMPFEERCFNPIDIHTSVLNVGFNRVVYYVGEIDIPERPLHIVMKKFLRRRPDAERHSRFDPSKVEEWGDSVFACEAKYSELYFSGRGGRVPYFYMVSNYNGDLATLTEDLSKGKSRALIHSTGPEIVCLMDDDTQFWYADLKHLMQKGESYPEGIKFLHEQARLDIS